jgi:hypothetical protein
MNNPKPEVYSEENYNLIVTHFDKSIVTKVIEDLHFNTPEGLYRRYESVGYWACCDCLYMLYEGKK